MSTFIGLCLLACGLPSLAASCAALRLARGRGHEEGVAFAALLMSMVAVVAGGLLIA